MYLPEHLNVQKMYNMYREKYPASTASITVYRNIFNTSFNISFGYPRSDTCATCDEYIVKESVFEKSLREMENSKDVKVVEERENLKKNFKPVKKSQELHKRKAETFYERKRETKNLAKTDNSHLAICMDYCKNLPCPNITCNDVYYKRQLSF